jgi:hypothetical protein
MGGWINDAHAIPWKECLMKSRIGTWRGCHYIKESQWSRSEDSISLAHEGSLTRDNVEGMSASEIEGNCDGLYLLYDQDYVMLT